MSKKVKETSWYILTSDNLNEILTKKGNEQEESLKLQVNLAELDNKEADDYTWKNM